MKKFGLVLAFIAGYPALCIAGFLVANVALEPDFEPVDLSDPPLDLAVLGAWAGPGGRLSCRAFYRLDLLRHRDSIPDLRFSLSAGDMAICQTSIEAFRREHEWPDAFSWERRAWGVSASQPDPDNPRLFEVAYPSDEDRVAVTRYEVNAESGQPTALEFRGAFGPAVGIGIVLFGGAGGTIAWILLVLWYVITRRRSAFGESEPAGEAL